MKREEAIHELQEDKRLYETEVCYAGDGTPDGRLLEAIDMAIEALSAEPTEDYSDLPDIPRAYYEKIVGNMSHDINMLKQQLEDRPSGEWIKRGTKITCSNCKSAWSTSFDTIIVGMRYCPSCGARMKGGNSE